jgi:alanyl-tRNA synthetase
MDVKQIRSTFLDFFGKNQHTVVQSSPLIPHNDPTLMFTNAGMVQFKNYFTGLEKPNFTRAASSQKCVRAGGKHNDLENVGYTARHHTFFEMLGNFSFGDYFKEEAIELAWKCLTQEFALPKDKLYITVYHTDDEAYNIWRKLTGFGADKILKIPTNDNFWAMGDVGPCGPCSEIFFDHGDKIWGGLPGTPEGDGDRYIEIWNLVFMQYEDQVGGGRINLPKPSIDTGMGLERISAVLQGKHNNYEIDLFMNLIEMSQSLSKNKNNLTSHRVIADHIRSSSFLIADGVMPSNEGRGYVLRRIMRRAMRHVNILGVKEPMLYKLVPTLISEMADAFPELRRAEAVIASTLQLEEERFLSTLDKGIKLLEETAKDLAQGQVFDGKAAFKLYDTYGFPIDLTNDILRARGITVDQNMFDSQMEEQKRRARAAWSGSGEKATDELWYNIHEKCGATEFTGYTSSETEAQVQAIIIDGKEVNQVQSGEAFVVLNQTPFYGESGGQIGDTGTIAGNEVIDTLKYPSGIFAHKVMVQSAIKVGDTVRAKIDIDRRNKIRANHSATHLLHKALRSILGEHVTQKGSLVAQDRFRFDYSHNKPLTQEEVMNIELFVGAMIIANSPANTALMAPDEAVKKGAMALFGEKYGDEVRVVSMGDSVELCGGTHVGATGDIGMFKIVTDEAIAAGIRRIEAVTGLAAMQYMANKERLLDEATSLFKCAESDLLSRVSSVLDDRKKLEKELGNIRVKLALSSIVEPIKIGSTMLSLLKLDDFPAQDLKAVADRLIAKLNGQSIVVVAAALDDKVSILVCVSQDLITKVKAGEIIKLIANDIKGNGGGRPEMAQAGGTNPEGIDSAFEKIKHYVNATL